ncbi:MAG TPA: zinc ribbon domain-containing protein, partial [Vicinamibacterales bacterium]
EEAESTFHVWHFFVLLSLLAASVAVVLTRPGRPELLILGSLTIGAAGAAAFGVYRTLAPLTTRDVELANEPLSSRLRADLEREKALTLRSIKELEFDRAMGKLSTPDFDEMAGRLRARAIGIMKQLDADRSPYRAVIEKELAARLGQAPDPDLSRDRPGPVPGQARARRLAPGEAAVCACGTSNDRDARFCKSCGAKLGD